MKTLEELVDEFLNGKIGVYEYSRQAQAIQDYNNNLPNLTHIFAQALLDNENSQRCDFCATGYCYDNHEPDCVIMKAKEYLEGNE